MDFTVHPALDETYVLSCSHGNRLLVVVEPSIRMATLCLSFGSENLVWRINLLACGHCRTGLCIADGFIIVVGIGLLNALGQSSNNAIILDSWVK